MCNTITKRKNCGRITVCTQAIKMNALKSRQIQYAFRQPASVTIGQAHETMHCVSKYIYTEYLFKSVLFMRPLVVFTFIF